MDIGLLHPGVSERDMDEIWDEMGGAVAPEWGRVGVY